MCLSYGAAKKGVRGSDKNLIQDSGLHRPGAELLILKG